MNPLIFVGDVETMDTVLIELLKNSPTAAAIIIVMFMFMKQNARREKSIDEMQERWHSNWRGMQERSITAINETNAHYGRMEALLEGKKVGR